MGLLKPIEIASWSRLTVGLLPAGFVLVLIAHAFSALFAFSELPASEAFDSVGRLMTFWNITRGSVRGDEGWSVAVDNESNVYFAGFDRNASVYADVFVYRLTPEGSQVWNASWSRTYDDEAFIATVKDGYVYVGGRTFSNLSFDLRYADLFLLKFDAMDGSLVWNQTWDGGGNGYDEVDGLIVDGNSVYVAGWANSTSTWSDVAVLKFDVNGTLIWSRVWGTPLVDEANGQIAVDENHVYVVGHYNATPFGLGSLGGDAVLASFSTLDGSYEWNVTWGGSGLDDAFGLAADSSHLYSLGITNSFGDNGIFLLKYNKTGSLVWERMWGGNGSEIGRAVDLDLDSGNIYVAANTKSFSAGDYDVILLRYDQEGNLTLSKTWGGAELDLAHGMMIDGPYIYIAGETASWGQGYEDALLLKTDLEGENIIPEFAPYGFSVLFMVVTSISIAFLHARRKHLERAESDETGR